MLNDLKRALVESYVGTIALGYLLAECVLHFSYVFSAPVARWIAESEYRALTPKANVLVTSPLRFALPELIRFVLLILVWFALLRWLYASPFDKKETDASASAK